MTIGIKYFAHGHATGYGLAALGYIRALHNAGVPVWPFFFGPHSSSDQAGTQSVLPLGRAFEGDATFADLPALMRATARPIEYDKLIVHTIPEHWQLVAEKGKQLVGYTVWETDALPRHWPDLLNRADRILVPCQFNAELCAASGVVQPVHVVPHVKRYSPSRSMRDAGIALRERLGIPADHFVFYTISAWDPRKAIDELIDAFASEFSAEDPVALLVKTSSAVEHATKGTEPPLGIRELCGKIIATAVQRTGRPAANVVVIAADDLSGSMINAIHAAGDAYVSLTHGEGWGLGAFDAATLGKPVIITGWGGQLDYLGPDYPGLVRYEMTPVTGWDPDARYRATQRWANADKRRAAQIMRAAVARDGVLFAAAASVRDAIAERYAEQVVARQFIASIDGLS